MQFVSSGQHKVIFYFLSVLTVNFSKHNQPRTTDDKALQTITGCDIFTLDLNIDSAFFHSSDMIISIIHVSRFSICGSSYRIEHNLSHPPPNY